MYIGPWQEYSLSKARTTAGVNEQLRPSIEQALLSTLDPEAAQKALEAMKPYLDGHRVPQPPREGRNVLHHAGRRRTTRELPALHSSINSPLAISARERNLQAASPLSVRSTKSEPIRYSHVHQSLRALATPQGSQNFRQSFQTDTFQDIPDIAQPSLSQMDIQLPARPAHTQPTYDAAAAVNFLRLERNARARTEIAKLTGWKLNTTLGSVGLGAHFNSSGTGVANMPSKKPPAGTAERKLEQLQALKQQFLASLAAAEAPQATGQKFPPLHKNGGAALTMSNVALHNSQAIKQAESLKLPPIHGSTSSGTVANSAEDSNLVVPHTPRVGDMELTDEAFSLVSKYFQQVNTIGGTSPSPGPSNRPVAQDNVGAGALLSHPTAKAPARMVVRRDGALTPLTDDIESETNSIVGSGYAGGSTGSPVPHPGEHSPHWRSGPIMATMEKFDQDDEGPPAEDPYAGGIDGLLLWSKQLDTDFL